MADKDEDSEPDDEDDDEEEEDDEDQPDVPKAREFWPAAARALELLCHARSGVLQVVLLVICHEPLDQAKIAEREASILVNADILDEAYAEVASETHAELTALVEAGELVLDPPVVEGEAVDEGEAPAPAPPLETEVVFEAPVVFTRPPELQVKSTTTVGELKEALNTILGEALNLNEREIADMPRLKLMTGRRVWSDVFQVRAVVMETGSMSEMMYGQVRIQLLAADLRVPPFMNEAEKADLERLEMKRLELERAAKQQRKKRPGRTRRS